MLHVSNGTSDTLNGSAGDTLIGLGQNETFEDQGGNASALGFDPSSPFAGSTAQTQTFALGGGHNTVYGGMGSVKVNAEGGNNIVIGHVPGVTGVTTTATVTVGGDNNTVVINGGDGSITSTGNHDFLVGTLATDGHDGNVTITASGDGDVIVGGTGNDTINYSGHYAIIVAGNGAASSVTLNQTSATVSNFVACGSGRDTVNGSAGTDTVQMGTGAQTINLAPTHTKATLQFGFQGAVNTTLNSGGGVGHYITNFNPVTDIVQLSSAHYGDAAAEMLLIDGNSANTHPGYYSEKFVSPTDPTQHVAGLEVTLRVATVGAEIVLFVGLHPGDLSNSNFTFL